jgi:hypothetical protein
LVVSRGTKLNNSTGIVFERQGNYKQQFFCMLQICNGPVILVAKVQVADAMKKTGKTGFLFGSVAPAQLVGSIQYINDWVLSSWDLIDLQKLYIYLQVCANGEVKER